MAPTLRESILTLLAPSPTDSATGHHGGPLVAAKDLLARTSLHRRDDDKTDPSRGVLDPHDISNVGFFVLFALIGVAFVCTGIWFFFWAKNGGFYFKENDWDDYKTTVLRRRGPNGTLLSGATESTNLGGGSVYKDVVDDDGRTVVTESTALSGITAGPSDIGAREKRERKREMRERERERRRNEKESTSESAKRSKRHVGTEGVEDEEAERAAKEYLRNYRHEKAARVGGLNKESEGSQWDGSTNPGDSTVSSNLLSNKQATPTSTPTKAGGIRKVYSTTTKNESPSRHKEPSRRSRREDGPPPAASSGTSSPSRVARRDFSYQRSVVGSDSALTESLLEGTSSDLGTKSYHHPRPELRAQRQKEREERRARRGGYRRGRGEDDEEL
ncbi:uncharacterized protein J7T54_000729 [Emericellopsis cladophorae]|uniref:Endosomal spry domain-containing protein n=1 Tax=Emericellopsis cladophorae TaxID=2686198 RepID=A0A9Q0BES5_9HYPO|nr:uncharacterized protein J7T54_000729 [Emericellopsis cladophorae]KAI6783227.1 hypothetical protein J7T54_000729 [Emericellopsis cladophorae]